MIFTSALFFYAVVSLLMRIGGITLCTGLFHLGGQDLHRLIRDH